MQFTEFALDERLQHAIVDAGYSEPTPIQDAALPVALEGRDLIGTAQTGTGKTAAFVLPILQQLLAQPRSSRRTRALILTPTRELAEQIHQAIGQLAKHTNIRSATIYGGVGMAPQERALIRGVEIIVACPGRLLDHLERGNADLSEVECLVLDEADRMLDMGFLPPIKRIIAATSRNRQTMLFSATFDQALHRLIADALQKPARIEIGIAAPASTVAHQLYPVAQHLKTALLLRLIGQVQSSSVLIFTRTKHRANRVAEQLLRAGHRTAVMHANKSQNQRQQALDGFRSGTYHVLVATDIAARGIDVASISHVINYDIPDCADSYIHRIGRTGRAARQGEALTLVTTADVPLIRDIEKALRAPIPTQTVEGFDYAAKGSASDEAVRAPRPPREPRRGPSFQNSRGKAPAPTAARGNARPAPARAAAPSGMTGRPAPTAAGADRPRRSRSERMASGSDNTSRSRR
ncbi:MAG TPA: DEAD/DEAH box helicase [Armatimonadota bacterium]|jgi:ATP-dependent RNA helicase RhlE